MKKLDMEQLLAREDNILARNKVKITSRYSKEYLEELFSHKREGESLQAFLIRSSYFFMRKDEILKDNIKSMSFIKRIKFLFTGKL